MRFPNPSICRHAVAADILSLMESRGCEPDLDLITTIVDANDETALSRLEAL